MWECASVLRERLWVNVVKLCVRNLIRGARSFDTNRLRKDTISWPVWYFFFGAPKATAAVVAALLFNSRWTILQYYFEYWSSILVNFLRFFLSSFFLFKVALLPYSVHSNRRHPSGFSSCRWNEFNVCAWKKFKTAKKPKWKTNGTYFVIVVFVQLFFFSAQRIHCYAPRSISKGTWRAAANIN